MIRVRLFIFCFLIAGGAASAEDAFEFWPGAQYDPSVPTFLEVLGHQPGQEIVSHVEILLYLRALEAADPHRMQIHEYARSWEGRELVYAVISSAANMARIEEIRQGIQRVADPREGSEAQRRLLVESLPATVWLGYSVHGDEVSGADAALLTAYHLLASTEDSMVQQILSGSVILIDPLQNPDGRERFIQNFRTSRGLEADSHPLAAEQNTPWPGGRTNHYFFDLNRDWLAATQPETQGRIRALQEWYPLVFVDLHEMGSNSTYFFAPEADPFNPHLAEGQKASLEIFGRNNAKWFDRFGFDYFTREV
ncbi:peptidase M14, partial [Candidatus Sumerlaeota bacterium]|nr:peptidase M14 [Candidatus Sumerlaeota bacterium]